MDKAGLIDEARSEAGLLLGADSMGLPPLTTDGARNVYTAYQHEGDPWDAARIRLGQRLHGIGDAALRARIRPYQQYPNPLGYPTMYGGARY
jgi:hypothetical protein